MSALTGTMKETLSLRRKTEDSYDIHQPLNWQRSRMKSDSIVPYDSFNRGCHASSYAEQQEIAWHAVKMALREGERNVRMSYHDRNANQVRENVEEIQRLSKRKIHQISCLPGSYLGAPHQSAYPEFLPQKIVNSPQNPNTIHLKRSVSADSASEEIRPNHIPSRKVPCTGTTPGVAPPPSKSWEENFAQLRVKLAAHLHELKKCSTMNIERLNECSDSNTSYNSDSDNENITINNIDVNFNNINNNASTFNNNEYINCIPTKAIIRNGIPSPTYIQKDTIPSPVYDPEDLQSLEDIQTRTKGQIKEKLFKCELCPKAFTQKCNLTKHIRVHTNEKPYKCQYCSKAFTQKAYLVPHLRTHTNEKPFECPHCGKAFTQKHDLTKHIRIHTNVRPYACTFCDKAFVQKSALTSHIRTHTKEKPFACTYCSKAFNQKYDLTKHIRTHTKEKSFSCSSCQKAFSRKDYFNIHKKLCSKLVA